MRFALEMRSARDSGRPCRVLDLTASTSASESVQSTRRALIVHSPRSFAASTRCIPSIMREPRFWTRMAGKLYRPGRVGQQPDMGRIRSFVPQMEPGHQRGYRDVNLRQLLDRGHRIGLTAIRDCGFSHFSQLEV